MGVILRFSIAAMLLLGFIMIRRIPLKIPGKALKILIISAMLLYPVNFGLVYWAGQYLNSGVIAVFFSIYPIITGILSIGILHTERLTTGKIIGLLLGFTGITVIFFEQMNQTAFQGMILVGAAGVSLGSGAAALSMVLVKKYLHGVRPAVLSVYQMGVGIPILAILAFCSGESLEEIIPVHALFATLYLGAVPSAFGFVIYYLILQQLSPVTVSLIHYVNPILALLAGWVILHEPVTVHLLYGTLVVLGGVVISNYHLYWRPLKLKVLQLVH